MFIKLLEKLNTNKLLLAFVFLFIISIYFTSQSIENFTDNSAFEFYDNNGRKQKIKIAVTMLVIGKKYRKSIQPCIDSKIAYCKKHNYDLIICKRKLIQNKHLIWSKIPLIEKYLDKYDWILCTDADTLVMNKNIKLEESILPNKNYNAIFNEEEGSVWLFFLREELLDYIIKVNSDLTHISTSEMLFRSCDWTKKFLKSLSTYRISPYLFISFTEFLLFHNLQEQGYLTLMCQLEPEYRTKIKVLTKKNKFSCPIKDNSKPFNECLFIDFQGVRNELLAKFIEIFTKKGYKSYSNRSSDLMEFIRKSKYCKKRKNNNFKSSYFQKDKWHLGNTKEYDKYFQYPDMCFSHLSEKARKKVINKQNSYLLQNLPPNLKKFKSKYDKLNKKELEIKYAKDLYKYLKIPIDESNPEYQKTI